MSNNVKCTSCGKPITPDIWNDISENQVRTLTFGDKDFSFTFKVDRPDKPKTHYHGVVGEKYFGIEECENGFVVRIGGKKYVVSTQAEAFEIRDKFRGWGLEGVNEYLKVKEESKDIKSKVCICCEDRSITFFCDFCGGIVPIKNIINIKAERELPKKEVHTVLYVTEKDGTPIRLIAFNKALTIGEVNELLKQTSGDRAFTLGGDKDKPFCDLF